MSALLEAHNLTKIYREERTATTALKDASFTIKEGEFVSIMGPSGSGKSTLLHILGLLDRPTSGRYLFDGQDTADLTDVDLARIRNQKMGFVFQVFHLLRRTTVLDNVILPLQYTRLAKREQQSRAHAALAQVHMEHRLHHTTAQLSGGEKQRVAIARALVNKPRIIFADEPTGNLDSKTGVSVMDTIDNLHQQGHTIIVITHETSTAHYAGRIINLLDGQITADRPSKTQHPHDLK